MKTEHKPLYCDLLGCTPTLNPGHYVMVPEPRVGPGWDWPKSLPDAGQRVEAETQLLDSSARVLEMMCEECWEFHGIARDACPISCKCHALQPVSELDLVCAEIVKSFATWHSLLCPECYEAADSPGSSILALLVCAIELLPGSLRRSVIADPSVKVFLTMAQVEDDPHDPLLREKAEIEPRYEVDDCSDGHWRAIDFAAFIADNHFEHAESNLFETRVGDSNISIPDALRALKPGEEYWDGGGATPVWKVRRTR